MTLRSGDPTSGPRHPRGRRWIALVIALTAIGVISVLVWDRRDDPVDPATGTGSVTSEPAADTPPTVAPSVEP